MIRVTDLIQNLLDVVDREGDLEVVQMTTSVNSIGPGNYWRFEETTRVEVFWETLRVHIVEGTVCLDASPRAGVVERGTETDQKVLVI